MNEAEKERLIKKDIVSIENRVRHAFNQGYEMGMKENKEQSGDEELDFVPEHKKIPCTLIIGKPCEDAISRQAAIDATWFEPSYTDPLNVLTEVRDRLKALPSAQPEQRWNPCSERLPEKKGDYLVTQKATFSDYVYRSIAGYALNLHDVDEYDFADKKRSGWYVYDSEWGYYEIDGVIAWMPLPPSYQGRK